MVRNKNSSFLNFLSVASTTFNKFTFGPLKYEYINETKYEHIIQTTFRNAIENTPSHTPPPVPTANKKGKKAMARDQRGLFLNFLLFALIESLINWSSALLKWNLI